MDVVWVWSQWFWVFGFFAVENIGGMLRPSGCAEEDEDKFIELEHARCTVFSAF